MRLPKVHGVIRRRLLVNYRVDPDVVARQLPQPFRPKLYRDTAIAGICLIRLEEIRPKGFPRLAGLSSENAAHRIAVERDDAEGRHEGVYIPRRDTGSLVNQMAGGRLFPGEYRRATSGRHLDRIVLTTHGWAVSPLDMERVHSSYVDCTLIMRNVSREWPEGASLYL